MSLIGWLVGWLLCVDVRPLLTSMYDSLFSRLQDNVAPVREAAAIAIGCIVSANGTSLKMPQTTDV